MTRSSSASICPWKALWERGSRTKRHHLYPGKFLKASSGTQLLAKNTANPPQGCSRAGHSCQAKMSPISVRIYYASYGKLTPKHQRRRPSSLRGIKEIFRTLYCSPSITTKFLFKRLSRLRRSRFVTLASANDARTAWFFKHLLALTLTPIGNQFQEWTAKGHKLSPIQRQSEICWHQSTW